MGQTRGHGNQGGGGFQVLRYLFVESPRRLEILAGEGEVAGFATALAEVGALTNWYVVRSKDEVSGLLQSASGEAATGRTVVVHLSCHGGLEGLEFTDGSVLTWSQVRRLLAAPGRERHLNTGGVVLCLSACEALRGLAAEASKGWEENCWLVVGSTERHSWEVFRTAYAAFYKQLGAGFSLDHAIREMRTIGGSSFVGCVLARRRPA